MIENLIFEKIIDAANHAPSGDNCQPWRFVVKDNEIYIYLLPERDTSLYSWGDRASIIANGAAIENAVIAAKHLGFEAKLTIFPDSTEPQLTAKIHLSAGTKSYNDLYESIFNRCTNRKPYSEFNLTEEQKKTLKDSAREIEGAEIALLSQNSDKKPLGQAVAINEEVLFGNYNMHKFFYDHINWDAGEELRHRFGFYVKTLEIPAPAMPGFKLAKNWSIMRLLNKVKFAKFISKQNCKIYSSCSVMGGIILNSNSTEDYLAAGRVFERLWLQVTAIDLSLQPLTGIFLLNERIKAGDAKDLSEEHIQKIAGAYKVAENILQSNNKTIAFMFRIGKGGQPSSRTLRLPPNIKWLDQ